MLERHSSLASGVDERDADAAVASSGRRHTTGQVPDRATKIVTESKHHGGRVVPVDAASFSGERGGRVLMTEVDKSAGDVVVEVGRRTSPRRVTVDIDRDAERARPSTTQLGGHAASYPSSSYQCRRSNELLDKPR